jgi:hypothetical protein
MSKLSKFLGEPKEFELNGEKLKVYPLTVKDMLLFSTETSSKEEMNRINKEIIKKSLRDEDTITDEEIDNLPVTIFTELMSIVNEVNGFNEENDRIRKIRAAQKKDIKQGPES